MSSQGIFRPPPPRNEPVKGYLPGSPERSELRVRLAEMQRERLDIPNVIGGEDVRTGKTFEAVMPHRKDHVLADVHQGGTAEVEQAIDAAGEAWHDWSRMPWEERAAIFLRAAELLSGPWRATLTAATMLNQSKTAYQAEIDAAAELIDFWRFNVEYLRPDLRGAAGVLARASGTGWSTGRSRASSSRSRPFNFTAIGGNLTDERGADGQHGRLEARVDRGGLGLLDDAPARRRPACPTA